MLLSQQAGELSTPIFIEQGNDSLQYCGNKAGGFDSVKFHHDNPPFTGGRGHGDCYQQCGL